MRAKLCMKIVLFSLLTLLVLYQISKDDATKSYFVLDKSSSNETSLDIIPDNISSVAACSFCDIYDVNKSANMDYECVDMLLEPINKICIYNRTMDKFISAGLIDKGVWEPETVKLVQTLVRQSGDMGFIDVGANIGVYSVAVASMGHPVVAVEPNIENVRHLHKSAQVGGFQDRLTIFRNAVSNTRAIARVVYHERNQGVTSIIKVIDEENISIEKLQNGAYDDDVVYTKIVYLDDILPYCRFRRAMMKIDIEGFEHRAFSRAHALLDQIQVTHIFMEWKHVREYSSGKKDSEDKLLFQEMIRLFQDKGYIPLELIGSRLRPIYGNNYANWPRDVVWQLLNIE